MSEVIFKTFATFFVIYGLIEMFSKLLKLIKERETSKKELYIFIHVRNQEHCMEYIIRTTIFNYFVKYGGRTVPNIVVVDKGSDDNTEQICRKLCEDYEFLYYTTEKEFIEFKNEIS